MKNSAFCFGPTETIDLKHETIKSSKEVDS